MRRASASAVDAALWLAAPVVATAVLVAVGAPGWLALVVSACAAVLATLLAGLVTGLDGRSPGRVVTGLRVVGADARPLGVDAGVRRSAVKACAGVTTCGVAWLRWGAAGLVDASGAHRTPLDLRSGSYVLDVRPEAAPPPAPPATRTGPVNLTAQRLVVPEAPDGAAAVEPGARPPSRVPARTLPEPDPGGWRLVADTGESVALSGSALVGRDPDPAPGVRHLVALRSDDGSLSRSHVRVGPVADGGLVLLDDSSTNGTVVVRAGVARPVPRGHPVPLVEGDRVRLGDRWLAVHRDTRVVAR